MNQMYSQRYGTPPVANATGGLVDTIADDDVLPTGFLMDAPTVPALLATVRRALAAYRDPIQWRAIQLNGMDKDLGWTRAAQEYLAIYGKIIGVRSTS
jgi:starch synthase